MLVLAGYDYEHILNALSVCNGIAYALELRKKVLVINNSDLKFDLFAFARGWTLLRGSNSNHEFSAWQEALDALPVLDDNSCFAIFANDTIGRSKSEFDNIDLHSFICRVAAIRHCEAVGFVAPYENHQSLTVLGCSSNRRLCTALFAVATPLLRNLDARVDYQSSLYSLLSSAYSPTNLISETAPLSLRSHLHHWLLGGGWHSAGMVPMSPSEFERLRAKALCILNEIYFSIRCEQAGGTLVALAPFAQTAYFRRMIRLMCDYQSLRQRLMAAIPLRLVRFIRILKAVKRH